MSTDVLPEFSAGEGVPELTALGKQLEILRIERGVSKQRLARRAGTSRQQLWRVMTGKSELTSSLRERLAAALAVDPATLLPTTPATRGAGAPAVVASVAATSVQFTSATVSDYLTDAAHVAATLRTP